MGTGEKILLSHNNQNTKHSEQKKSILKTAKEKSQVTYKGRFIRIITDFSPETMKAIRPGQRSCRL